MKKINDIAVFCGASSPTEPTIQAQAQALGAIMAQKSIGLIYGGAKIGVMGTVAASVLKEGGAVTGVIPEFLEEKEIIVT